MDLENIITLWLYTRLPDVSAGKDESFVCLTAGIPLSSQFCPLTILDDAQYPVIEGLETFVVYLSSPHGAELAKPFQAIVAINDIIQDGKVPLAAGSVPFQPLGSLCIPSTVWLCFCPLQCPACSSPRTPTEPRRRRGPCTSPSSARGT